MRDLDIRILTQALLLRREAENTLRSLSQSLPALAPLKYGYGEPLKFTFQPDNMQLALEDWYSQLVWRSYRYTSEGILSASPYGRIHSYISIVAKSKVVELDKAIAFLLESSARLETDFAYIHLSTPTEREIQGYKRASAFRVGLTNRMLRKYLPNLAWGTVLGAPYVELFGRDTILSVPAQVVKEIAKDIFYVQLTESLFDMVSNYEEFDAVRQKVKLHLNPQAFLDPELGEDYTYNVPTFNIIKP